jgi:hypothetical protein
MKRRGAVEIEEIRGPEPQLESAAGESMAPVGDRSVMAGRVRQPGSGPQLFVW